MLAENLMAKISQIPDCSNSIDINADWVFILRATISASNRHARVAKRKHEDWFDENDAEIKDTLREHNEHRETVTIINACITSSVQERGVIRLRLNCELCATCAGIQEHQAYADRHAETKEFYASLKAIYGPKHCMVVPV